MTGAARQGRLNVVGVGPGDPDLVTLKAARLIAAADVVAYPVTESGRSRARATAGDHIGPEQVELGFRLPMSVDPAPAQRAYDAVSHDIRGHLAAGRTVALLCEGDPFFYGSAMYIYQRLAADCDVHVVPGVSSLTATAAVAGVPLASRNDVLKVVPAPLEEAALRGELDGCHAAAIIKVGRHFAKVRRVIEALGRVDDTVLVEAATGEAQRVVALAHLPAGAQDYFSTVLIAKGGRA